MVQGLNIFWVAYCIYIETFTIFSIYQQRLKKESLNEQIKDRAGCGFSLAIDNKTTTNT